MRFTEWSRSRTGKIAVLLLKIAAAAGILALLIWKFDLKLDRFKGLSVPLLVAAGICLVLQNALTGVRWYFLMRALGIRVGIFPAVSLSLQGVFFTLFIPGGAVSGDVIKAGLVTRRAPAGERLDAAFSILIDRITGLAGLLLLAWTAALTALVQWSDPAPALRALLWTVAAAAPLGLAAIAAAFCCDLFLKVRWINALFLKMDRLSRGALGRLKESLSLYRKHWKTVLWCMLASGFAMTPLIAMAFLLAATAVAGEGAVPFFSVFLAAGLGEMAGILPLTPGGIGTRDVAVLEIFRSCGCGEEQAAMIPVVYTSVMVLASLVGGVFLLYDAVMRLRHGREA